MRAPRLPKSVSLNPIQEYASFSGHMRSNDLFSSKAIMQEHKPHRCHLIANKYSRNKRLLLPIPYIINQKHQLSIVYHLPSHHSYRDPNQNHTVIHLKPRHAKQAYVISFYHDSNSKENWESLRTTHREGEGSYLSNYKLRVSHKLAERKRRREIKNLVDALKSTLPVDKSAKISKWEILSRAVEYISLLRNRDCHRASELLALRKELHLLQSKQATDEKYLRYH
ncbi:hypothetical protein A0J61_07212 [Choanephora cucurbitarum]|uniref:BHLH domain-containing protein n=1 Tax=Choanephora cucurbitarum TaxID=101091 RepID=A0A1C7N6R1_9FUNG|nr:hypothetical protein A0J61_07212 [Choanephora cucurbitarum]